MKPKYLHLELSSNFTVFGSILLIFSSLFFLYDAMANNITTQQTSHYIAANVEEATYLKKHFQNLPVLDKPLLGNVYSATCTTPTAPAISVTDNVCDPYVVGAFNITTDCGAGSHIEWSTDDGSTWQTIVPTYRNNSTTTVIARCVADNDTSCVSINSNEVVSAPTVCPVDCSTPVCDALSGDQIGGVVFEDWNCNGEMDQGSTAGVQNVEVKIFDCDNNEVATAITDSSGSYLFNGLTSGETYRIEFSLPDSVAFWGNPSSQGTANATDVQFFTPGSCANFGLSNPYDYCESDPFLVTPCYINGDPLAGGTAAGEDALVALNYSGTSKIMLATTDEVGAVWGVAQRAKENKVYSSAVLKRHSGYGPLGVGGIYCSNFDDTTTVNFLDVETIGIDVGEDPRDPIDPANTLSIDKTEPSQDSIAFHLAGLSGIGDLDFSDDGNTLWLTNLNDGQIYTIDMSNGTPTSADVSSCSLPDPCNAGSGEAVPWGLKYYRGYLYVGMVCNARLSQNTADLSATVYRLNPADCSTCEVLSFPLDYVKGHAASGYAPLSDRWYPWANTWEDLPVPVDGDGVARPALRIYPQPILSDIEFTDDGNMVLGFVDRTGFQVGQANMDIYGEMYNGESFGGYGAMVGGDILRVEMKNSCEGILENNAAVECLIGDGENNEEGPGGGEFYTGDEFGQHEETALGGLAVLPGSNELISSTYDPLGFDSGGLEWLDNTTGGSNMGYTLYDASSGPGYYGKGVGLGDVEVICTACAPLEIGNYVWCDTNENGLQDACESGVDGMTVQLYDASGSLVGQTTTANGGQYYFNNTNVDTTGVNPDGSAMTAYTGMNYNSEYFIVFGDSQFAAGEFTVGTETYTSITTVDVNSNGNENIDSDVDGGNLTSGSLGARPDGLPYIAITSDAQGCGNHRYDMGVICPLPADVSLTKTVDQAISELDSTVVFTITVYNEGGSVTGATVTDILPNGSVYITDDANGAYSNSTGIWTIGNMAAGDSAKLNLTVQLTQEGVLINEAFVTINEEETDTTNNDDRACVSIPVELCDDGSQSIDAVAEAGYTSYQWYVDTGDGNGYVVISGATQQTLTISAVGSYIYTVEDAEVGNCGDQMCCPIIVEHIPCVECPPKLCIPISVTKR